MGVSLHEVKAAVWYGTNSKLIIQSTFYMETINFDWYVRLILTEFYTQLTEKERPSTWFLQHSAVAHTTDESIMSLEGVFGDRKISRGYGQHIYLTLSHATCIYGAI
jgi:truncated hemoglobin YjbI